MAKHPTQPIELDKTGRPCFKGNAIIQYLVHSGKANLNDLIYMPFTDEDRMQFAQLIGYTVNGFAELPYSSEEAIEEADRIAEELKAAK